MSVKLMSTRSRFVRSSMVFSTFVPKQESIRHVLFVHVPLPVRHCFAPPLPLNVGGPLEQSSARCSALEFQNETKMSRECVVSTRPPGEVVARVQTQG
jgi:hypothetical protein